MTMRQRPLLVTVSPIALLLGVIVFPQDAYAICDVTESPQLACNTFFERSVGDDFFGSFLGLFGDDAYSGCLTGNDYDLNQDVWAFTCPYSGPFEINLYPGQCDLDLIVLDSFCDEDSTASCLGISAVGGTNPDSVTINCIQGEIYYAIIERQQEEFGIPFIYDPPCAFYADHDYSIETTCYEVCNDGFDNDGDGFVDCYDADDCPNCFEDCNDGIDNDQDGLVDCDDPDCTIYDSCCDKDDDGYIAIGGACGGDDCNDDPFTGNDINPGEIEVPADGIDANCDGLEYCYVDDDGDGFGANQLVLSPNVTCLGGGLAPNPDDCDDTNAAIFPGAPEIIADGVDSDCNGLEICYRDQDSDTFGGDLTIEAPDWTCTTALLSPNSDDCNDYDANVYPGATEFPVSGFDEDCDGLEACYEDLDNDGYGTPNIVNSPFADCIGPGISIRADDCNDTPGLGSTIFPGAPEGRADAVDQNCDGFEECWTDADLDGFGNDQGQYQLSTSIDCSSSGVSLLATDCNDGDPSIYPGAVEILGNNVDEDCDNLQDCYEDLDGDGFGSTNLIESAAPGCVGVGIAALGGDCNDLNPAINPGATEQPNDGIDQDCDTFELCYEDADADGFGSTATVNSTSLTCNDTNVSGNDDDCNDTLPLGPSIYPGAPEIPNNGIDENCDGNELCYEDADNDGYGGTVLSPTPAVNCDIAGTSPNNADCNDNDFFINPGVSETPANGVDENCDGNEDCYYDGDDDGYGIPVLAPSPAILCNTTNVAPNDDDCDDNAADVYPGAPPGPNGGIDYDCSGFSTCFQDLDGDGYGSAITISTGDPTCSAVGLSPQTGDCDDGNANIGPGATELPYDFIDQDCDGYELCYQDRDGDGFGSINLQPSFNDLACSAGGVSTVNTDCNDTVGIGADIYPGAPEAVADGVDSSCDGLELCYQDLDNDGYGRTTTTLSPDVTCTAVGIADNPDDCNDTPGLGSLFNPGQTEAPNDGVDSDCDGFELCYEDIDGDGFGSLNTIPSFPLNCTGDGVSQLGTDCLDQLPIGDTVYPGATEIPGNGLDEDCNGKEDCYQDLDGDGYAGQTTIESVLLSCNGMGIYPTGDDCNDSPGSGITINPGVAETPANGVDENCDGFEDCYIDADGDLYGSPNITLDLDFTCAAIGLASNGDDCYDVPPTGDTIYPGAPEIIGDGIDQDCDGTDGCYNDLDGDGYGRDVIALNPPPDCNAPGYSTRNDDCNDTPSGTQIHPDAPEIVNDGIDQNCDGQEDCYQDLDGDTWGTPTVVPGPLTCLGLGVSQNDDDCNDVLPAGAAINPAAAELPGDGVDQNCDGYEDCLTDADDDGFAGVGTTSSVILDCNGPFITLTPGDCDDASATVYPTAVEIPADGLDQNCDGKDACYQDLDADSFGSTVVITGTSLFCDGTFESTNSDDCLDAGNDNGVGASQIYPGQTEVCNGADDDCNGLVDDDDVGNLVSQFSWFSDSDGDGYGVNQVDLCTQPVGFAAAGGDCDDSDPDINPGELELCDEANVDENCNGLVNQDDPGVQPSDTIDETIYNGIDDDCDPATPDDDLDGDGVPIAADCNDNPLIGVGISPNNPESALPDGIDNDCDGDVDEGTTAFDDDGDGFTEDGGDCDDTDPTVHPGATETPDGDDEDCDNVTDEGTTAYDDDGDGFNESLDCNDGDPAVNPNQAEQMGNGIDDDCDGVVDDGAYDPDGDGYSSLGGDCDEEDPETFPGAPEQDDGVDNDCDGVIDEGTTGYDDDGDGQTENDGDCDDTNPEVFQGADELQNGIDDDCDGLPDNGLPNSDDDGDGFSENGGDCDDTNADVYPGADEQSNGIDDDCDDQVDEALTDADADGYPADVDCDDSNGWVHPNAAEVCDGVDNDCDELIDEGTSCEDIVPTDTGTPGTGDGCGGCSNTGAPSMWWLAVGMAAVLRRRRAA